MTSSNGFLFTPERAVHLLSNGRYSLVLSSAGGGFASWRDVALTRWREDPTRDDCGSRLLLRDIDSHALWSAELARIGRAPDRCEVRFSEGSAAFTREDGSLATTLDVAIDGDADAELRRLTLVNRGASERLIEVTSYAELVLGSAAADAAHLAFSKMFVVTDWVEEGEVLLATRRRSAAEETPVWAAHFVVVESPAVDVSESRENRFETDRAHFLGRCRELRSAQALQGAALSESIGCVLDPIFSLRKRVRIPAGGSARLAFWSVAAETRQGVLAQCAALRVAGVAQRTLEGSAGRAAAIDAKLGIAAGVAARYAKWIAPLLYADAAWRAPAAALARGSGGAPTLWAGGISGDRPIVVLQVAAQDAPAQVADLLAAQRGWQARWLGVDVVVLITASAPVAAALLAALQPVLDAHKARLALPGQAKAEAFLLRADLIPDHLRAGLLRVARVVACAGAASAAALISTPDAGDSFDGDEALVPAATSKATAAIPAGGSSSPAPVDVATLQFPNGYGGFAREAREYVIRLTGKRCTPTPWINVVANADFGFLVSAEGGGYSWSINSQQNPLTPWSNDPVSDRPHEVLYLRDIDSGEVWSACAAPVRVASAVYTANHGKGYSRFGCDAHGIELDLLQFVPLSGSVKISRLRLRNRSGRVRRLSVTAYVEWALAPIGVNAAPTLISAIDAATSAVFVSNSWRAEYVERVAFLDLGAAQSGASGDRLEFLGAHGDLAAPAALAAGTALSGRVGAGLDPCAALQTTLELEVDGSAEILCLLGDAPSAQDARSLIATCRSADLDAVLEAVRADWRDLLDTVQVRTPDPAMDLLLNDWLPYQALACRVHARTAYYQASGAYGFRDQLQDVMALCVARPRLAREQIVRAARRQFVEGDVQHWWLPPAGQGLRTRISDDRIWLVWVALHYVEVSGDAALLDEAVPFLRGDALKDGQTDSFFQPATATESASVYEHCARALDASLTLGTHDLPLFGTGDWNDGMNRVGAAGRGESVWLGWFLIAAIERFLPHAAARTDRERIARWQACVAKVRTALDDAGWDGAWYRRGYFDDGTPLGSAQNAECRIDQIAQSWSVLCGGNDPARAALAMAAVDEHLIRRDDRVAPLLTPPFDVAQPDPGYIQGYPPGLRENGGQYTHGATWSIFAFTQLGQGDSAAELFAILNPIRHGDSAAAIERYKVEPYVACGDVYSVAPLIGRGGWTWYTGSAAWLYRAGLEAILGFRVHGDRLDLDPVLPQDWPGYELVYRRRGGDGRVTPHQIRVENPNRVQCGIVSAEWDGSPLTLGKPPSRGLRVALSDDGARHRIRVVLG